MRRVNCETVSERLLFIPHQADLGDNTGAMVTEKPTLCAYHAIQDKTDGHGIVIAKDLEENEGPGMRDCVDKIVAEAQKNGLDPKELNYYERDADHDGWLQKVHLNEEKVNGEYPRSPVQSEYVEAEIAPLKLEAVQRQSGPEQTSGPNQKTAPAEGFEKNNLPADQHHRMEGALETIAALKDEFVQQQQKDMEQGL